MSAWCPLRVRCAPARWWNRPRSTCASRSPAASGRWAPSCPGETALAAQTRRRPLDRARGGTGAGGRGAGAVAAGGGRLRHLHEPDEDSGTRLRRAAVADVYEVRAAVEVQAARLAARRRTAADVAAPGGRAGRAACGGRRIRGGRFVAADVALHASRRRGGGQPRPGGPLHRVRAGLRDAAGRDWSTCSTCGPAPRGTGTRPTRHLSRRSPRATSRRRRRRCLAHRTRTDPGPAAPVLEPDASRPRLAGPVGVGVHHLLQRGLAAEVGDVLVVRVGRVLVETPLALMRGSPAVT